MDFKSMDERVELLLEAAEWNQRVANEEPGVSEAFIHWLRLSPAHLQAYVEHVVTDTELKNLDAARELDLPSLLTEALRDNKRSL